MKIVNDPANYRALSEPFENSDTANQAIEKFFDMVQEARKVCKIQDVHVLVKFHIIQDEVEKVAITSGHLGNSVEGLGMCVWGIKSELETQGLSIKEFLSDEK